MKFLQADRGSEWVARVMPYALLAQGKRTEAQESVGQMPMGVTFGRNFLQACLVPGYANELEGASNEFAAAVMIEPDPERRYANGALLAYCGEHEAALRAISSAIQKNYCAYSNLQHDPLLAKLRNTPEFTQLLSAPKHARMTSCQNERSRVLDRLGLPNGGTIPQSHEPWVTHDCCLWHLWAKLQHIGTSTVLIAKSAWCRSTMILGW